MRPQRSLFDDHLSRGWFPFRIEWSIWYSYARPSNFTLPSALTKQEHAWKRKVHDRTNHRTDLWRDTPCVFTLPLNALKNRTPRPIALLIVTQRPPIVNPTAQWPSWSVFFLPWNTSQPHYSRIKSALTFCLSFSLLCTKNLIPNNMLTWRTKSDVTPPRSGII